MRILVVEDEPRLLASQAKALREEGYAVDTADAGDEGLYKAENVDYDAIVLDVMLPRLERVAWAPPNRCGGLRNRCSNSPASMPGRKR